MVELWPTRTRLFNKACCAVHHQLCHPRHPISDHLPEQGPPCSWSDTKCHCICCNWWKTLWYTMCLMCRGSRGRGEFLCACRVKYQDMRIISLWTTAQMKWWCMRSPWRYWKISPQTGTYCSMLSNYQRPHTLQQWCMSINRTSVWLWIKKNSFTIQDHLLLHDKWSEYQYYIIMHSDISAWMIYDS